MRGWSMSEEMKNQQEQQEEKKIILPKEVQKELMKFFLRTSIPRKKRLEQERLLNKNNGSED